MRADDIALLVFALAQIADVYTTLRVLKLGGVELNPIVRFFMDRFGIGWAFIKLAIAMGGIYLIYTYGSTWMVWILAGLIGAAAANNFRFALKMERR